MDKDARRRSFLTRRGREGEALPAVDALRARLRSWRPSVAQFTVFINGCVLTLGAYMILTSMVRDMFEDRYWRLLNDTDEIVAENIMGLGQSVKIVSTILSLSGEGEDVGAVLPRVSAAVPNLGRFDRLFWIGKGRDGQWQMHDIVSSGRAIDNQGIFAPDQVQKLRDYVGFDRAHPVSGVLLSTELPLANGRNNDAIYVTENPDSPLIRARPFIFAHTAFPAAPEKGIVIGISRVNNVIDREWIAARPGIESLIIHDMLSDRRVFYMDRLYQSRDSEDAVVSAYQKSFNIGTGRWQLFVNIKREASMAFLQYVPLIVLSFGTILTMIGTMYVRNSQKQSIRLKIMNTALAQKNYDLNNEVAEREKLNLSLRKTEREYKAIVDSVSDIIFEISGDGEILFLNQTWQKIMGSDARAMLSASLFDLLHPQEQEEQRRSLREMIKGSKHAYRSLVRIRTGDGGYRTMELAVSMLRQDENRNTRIVGTLTDVEERRRAERALVEAEKKYRTIVENAAGGIYQVTPDGVFLSANPAMIRILGYASAEEMMAQVRDAKSLYDNPKERARFVRELETVGIVKNYEAQLVTKDGRKIWVNENARAVRDDEGSILYFEGSLEDITKRKEVELKLREAKIQSDLASRAKSEFLTNMSHELRTPLNAIIGFSEIIKNEVLGPVQNRQYWEYARDIYDSGRRLLSIINEILDVSRIDAGDRHLNEGVINIRQLVQSCVDFMTPKAAAAQLTITNLMDGDVPRIVGEELAIKQVILNLLSNAIKFTPGGGRVTLSHEKDSDGHLRLSITDTGIGLDEAEIEKALSPFGQVQTSFSRSGSGVGLGLTLVDSLVKLHGGRLELFSQKGIGTTATVVFPARRIVAEDSLPADEGEGAGRHFAGLDDSEPRNLQ